MENEVLYDSFAFDNKIISEKLGLYDYEPITRGKDINTSLKMAMMQQELEKNKAIVAKNNTIISELRNMSQPASVQPKNEPEKRFISALDNTQFILVVIFIAVLVCIIQYITYSASMSDMMQIINNFVKSIPVASNVSLSQASNTPVVTPNLNSP
jgi:hypothetical protein